MKLHTRCIAILLSAAVFASGCGSEGGVVGSGISTASISGNVIAVQEKGATPDLPPLTVRLEEFSEIEAGTSGEGTFELRGEFAGPVTVRFETLAGRLLGSLAIDVPAGAEVVLDDLELGPDFPGGVRLRRIRQRNLIGRVAEVDCRLPGFLLDDDVRRPFRVRLLPKTEIRLRPGGEPGTCADIRRGDFARVEGVLVAGVIEAVAVDVERGQRPPRR